MFLDSPQPLPPPPPSQHRESQWTRGLTDPGVWSTYAPGMWQQDLFTLPIEGGLLYLSSTGYTLVARPVWPFANEHNTGPLNNTRHSKTMLSTVGGLTLLGTFGTLAFNNKDFPLWNATSGLIHTHLLTELATGFAKRFWQRPRPFYHRKLEGGTAMNEGDAQSFFSGHSSHAFAYGVYMTNVLFHYVDNMWITYFGGAALLSGAAYVAAARAIDGQHHPGDVIAGAAVGGTMAQLVFWQMNKQVLLESEAKRGGTDSWQGHDSGSRFSVEAASWTTYSLSPDHEFEPVEVKGVRFKLSL